jgi:hypothetical protein
LVRLWSILTAVELKLAEPRETPGSAQMAGLVGPLAPEVF